MKVVGHIPIPSHSNTAASTQLCHSSLRSRRGITLMLMGAAPGPWLHIAGPHSNGYASCLQLVLVLFGPVSMQ